VRLRRSGALALAGAALAAALPAAASAYPTLVVGAAENAVLSSSLTDSKGQLELAAAAGLQTVRVVVLWYGGGAPRDEQLASYSTTARAASLVGLRLMVNVFPATNTQVPKDEVSRAAFASFAARLARAVPTVKHFVVGNEPNKQFFWSPQFAPDGAPAAPAAFTALLAATYDALKAVDPAVVVAAGGLAPRGNDKPNAVSNVSISPGNFILGMGAAYRASGRTAPIMDQFSIHPYGDRSEQPPTFEHPLSTTIGLGDYPKLVGFLGQAFDGTAQPGSTVPILYDEYGVQTLAPAEKASLYTNPNAPLADDVVTDDVQAAYYRRALQLASCQPNVAGLIFFHVVDETDLGRWQSGLYHPDGTPKTSFAAVRKAVLETRRGIIARCPGIRLPVRLLGLRFPGAATVPATHTSWRIRAGCAQDCKYVARLERLPEESLTLAARGFLEGGAMRTIALPERQVAPGSYRLTVRLVSRVNAGDPLIRSSRSFQVG
jgi:hypothetical protein